MPKVHWDSILIYIGFVVLIILTLILMITKFAVEMQERTDVSMYSKPTLHVEETTSTITSETTTIETTTAEPEDTGAGLYG